MPAPHFSPWSTPRQPCWHCRAFVGLDAAGSVARCNLSQGPRVRSQPAHGCSAFEREPGADDEPERRPEGRWHQFFLQSTPQRPI